MKKLFILGLLLAVVGVAFAAVSYSRSNYRMGFFGCNATYANAAATQPTAVICQAMFKRNYTNQSDANDAEESGPGLSVSFDLLASPSTQTTVNAPGFGGSITITDAQGAIWLRKRSETAGGL